MEPPGSNGFPFSTPTPFLPATTKEGRSLYVGNLDPKVNDVLLFEIFSPLGQVESCKIIKDRAGKNGHYGFVDFVRREDAQQALQLDGHKVYDNEIKVNWAVHARKDDSTRAGVDHHNIFVGDLSSDVTNELLKNAFDPFGTVTDARVMWDHSTGRSRGYGFVAFQEKAEADRAIVEMDGKWLGSRTIRCNWANQKASSRSPAPSHSPSHSGQHRSTNFEEIAVQSPASNSTIYVGNLPANTPESAVRTSFQNYGTIEEVRIQPGRCFGFVKFQNHEQATHAIIGSYDMTLGGQPIRCSWGKQKASQEHQPMGVFPHAQMYPPAQYYSQQPYPMYPYYSQPYQADPSFYMQAFDPYAAYAIPYQQQPSVISQIGPQQSMPQYMDGYSNPHP